MTTSAQSRSLSLALLAARQPCELAVSLIDPTAALPVAAGGYPVSGAQSAIVSLALREHAPARTARVQITSLVLTDTLTLTATGWTVAYDGSTASPTPTDAASYIDGVIAAIVADSGANAAVAAERDGADTLVIRWRSRAGGGLAVTRTGTGTYDCTLEYQTGTWRLYGRATTATVRNPAGGASDAIAAWQDLALGDGPAQIDVADGAGWVQGADVAPLAAVGVTVESLAGHADDAAAGTSGGVTTTYRAPVAYVARGVQGAVT